MLREELRQPAHALPTSSLGWKLDVFEMPKIAPHMLKGTGYLISTVSVTLLAIVSWSSASQSPLLIACLLGGAATSILGMFCRWLSYQIEKRQHENR